MASSSRSSSSSLVASSRGGPLSSVSSRSGITPSGLGFVTVDFLAFLDAVDSLVFPDESTFAQTMNNTFSTSGLVSYAIGSDVVFKGIPTLNGTFWDLTGGIVTLKLADQDGFLTILTGSLDHGCPQASWRVSGTPGQWTRAWVLTDASGRQQVSLPIAFGVVSSPF